MATSALRRVLQSPLLFVSPIVTPSPRQSLSLYELVHAISNEVQFYRKANAATTHYGKDYSSNGLLRLHQLLQSYDASRDEWRRYAFFDANKLYTRNLIAQQHDAFTLMLLCWNQHQASPVHDHAQSECFMRVLEGTITETQYRSPMFVDDVDAPLQDLSEYLAVDAPATSLPIPRSVCTSSELIEKRRVVAGAGSVLYINDEIAIHKVESSERAVSLHCYIPGYTACDVYNETTSSKHKAVVSFYSEHGQIIDKPVEPVTVTVTSQSSS